MKSANQVCSLEQAKKLKKLGVLQSSYFKHCRNPYQEHFNLITPSFLTDSRDELLSAYTATELGAAFGYGTRATEWLRNVRHKPNMSILALTNASWLADALIEAIENGFTTAAEVNERLKNS